MPHIAVVPLGAGQDVGRSCILVSIGGKNIMLDCGMHMGYNDARRFPDLTYITKGGTLDEYLDCVIISHFHLDHCGALPYMSEMVGYRGPIYMTHPTKAICPTLLEDYRKVQVEHKGEHKDSFFTSAHIANCMRKVVCVNLHETVRHSDDIEIKAYYAGHVIGAAMFHVRVGSESFVYTGDYNMTPDRHLGAAQIDRCCPDLLISESTYATTIRDSKRARERDFLKKVHECVEKGGKVLIPVFALGRAQELCILLESYWERMDLKVPIYFTMGLTEKATNFYKLFISWTNEKIKKTFVQRNMFDFKHILPFDKSYAQMPGPMVVFATPGMLHSGQSLRIFKQWAPFKENMIIMPGYCVAGTVGHKVINGAKDIEMDGRKIEIKLSVEYMSFSAHADAKGIMQLIRNCQPKHLIFVHGEKEKMEFLQGKIKKEIGIPVNCPANGETVRVDTHPPIVVDVSVEAIKRSLELDPLPSKRHCPFIGSAVMHNGEMKVYTSQTALKIMGLKPHTLKYENQISVNFAGTCSELTERLFEFLVSNLECSNDLKMLPDNVLSLKQVTVKVNAQDSDCDKSVLVCWQLIDDVMGSNVLKTLQNVNFD